MFAACGLDELGTQNGGNDGSVTPDVTVESGSDAGPPGDAGFDVVMTCADVDASLDASCLPPIPMGWYPVAVASDAGQTTCPGDAGDYLPVAWVTDPVITASTCYCSPCSAAGNWQCSGQIAAGGTCTTDKQTFTTAPYCWTNINHNTAEATLARTGSPSCSGGVAQGTNQASTTPISACIPQNCADDFCGLGGYRRCIYSTTVTDGGCPAQYPLAHIVSTGVSVTCNTCSTCAIQNNDAGCTGTLTEYSNTNCTGAAMASGAADGTCIDNNNVAGFNSVGVDASVAAPSCGSSGGAVGGTVQLSNAATVCCP